jgi:hypothetical protein
MNGTNRRELGTRQLESTRSRLLYYYCLSKSKAGGVTTLSRGRVTRLLSLNEEEEREFITTLEGLSSATCLVKASASGLRLTLPEEAKAVDVRSVFDYWRFKLGKKRARLTPTRKAKVAARVNEYGVDFVKLAIDGLASSRWHREKGQTDLELVCRSPERLEGFAERAKRSGSATVKRTNGVQLPTPRGLNGHEEEDHDDLTL